MLTVKCKICNAEYLTKPSWIKRGRKYCSKICSNKARRGIGWKKVKAVSKLICKRCNKEYIRPNSELRRYTSEYCTVACRRNEQKYCMDCNIAVDGRHQRCRSCSRKGDKNPSWRGGTTPKIMLIRRSKEYINWREKILARDNYTCQLCGKRGGDLEADHIKPFALFVNERFNLKNGRTLCKPCHRKTDTFGSKALNFQACG